MRCDSAPYIWPSSVTSAWLQNCLLILLSIKPILSVLILSMTKLLDANWLRGVQLFHQQIFSKQTKWRTGGISTQTKLL